MSMSVSGVISDESNTTVFFFHMTQISLRSYYMSSTMALWSRLARTSASSPARTFYWVANGHEYCDCNLQASFESTKVKTGFSLVLQLGKYSGMVWVVHRIWTDSAYVLYHKISDITKAHMFALSRSINTCKAELTADSNVQGTDHETPYNLHSSPPGH